MPVKSLLLIIILVNVFYTTVTTAQTPIMSWNFTASMVNGNSLLPEHGFPAEGEYMPVFSNTGGFDVATFNGSQHALLITDRIDTLKLPEKELSVAAWVMVDYPGSWGGILSVMQDNGSYEKGWVLGHVENRFSFGLASVGANVNDRGGMTYVVSSEPFVLGTWNYVVATYDGNNIRLFVNGELSGQSTAQSGNILYPRATWFTIGSYRDDDENHRLSGKLHAVQLWDSVIPPSTMERYYEQAKRLRDIPAEARISLDGITIKPYLNFITASQATIGWYATEPSTGYVEYGRDGRALSNRETIDVASNHHHITLMNLQPGTNYFYRVIIRQNNGDTYESDLLTFQTASETADNVSFGVIGDTQNNPAVWGQIATHLWAERPQFVIHAGDIVSPGTNLMKWIVEYFAPSKQLQERVPIYTVLGNHERNADYYYTFMRYPEPEYYYTFTFADVAFFMLDSNKDVTKDSEQYRWLQEQLIQTSKKWKIVVHHHPPYSSDENDYGDTWQTSSTRGDTSLNDLAALYENAGVDLVIAGHIHTYERTWPIANGKIDMERGTTYVVTGGAGGPLENAAPTRSWFTRKVYRGHHYNMVHIAAHTLEWITYDLSGQIIDQFTISVRSLSDR